jgi:hypothetical protein
MNWLAKLKNAEGAPTGYLQNLQKGAFVGFVDTLPGPFQKSPVRNQVCMARIVLCTDHGLDITEAEAIVERLTSRDQEQDERRLCLECRHLSGGPQARRCSQWQQIGQSGGPAIPSELVTLLQRCPGFTQRLTGAT